MTTAQHGLLPVPAMRPGRRTAPAAGRRPLPAAVRGADLRVANTEAGNSFSLLEAVLLGPYLDGTQPFARSKRLDRVRDEATLLPPGCQPVRSVVSDGRSAFLAVGDGWTLRALRWSQGGANVKVVAVSDELARTMLELAVHDATEELPEEDPRVEIGFWHLASSGPSRRELPIAAEPWAQIRRNYAAPVAAAIDQLVALDGSEVPGRILLVHGPPGTGKTTALRTLAKQWRAWCQLDFVLDPERLFTEPGYLIEVIMGYGEDDKAWRLLLLEDCDELIRPAAKAAAGQALSRLLNLTDGLLGQGRQVLVAITTNEDIARLHPAVTRPGRCLAQIEVGPLPYEQALAWLGDSSAAARVPGRGATLAELIALRDGTMPVGTPNTDNRTGLYL